MKHEHDSNAWLIESGGPSRGRRGRGGPPFGLGGPGGPGGPPGFGGPGPRGRGHRGGGRGRGRGDVRAAILILLAEQPRHGYDLIRAIEERTEGAWAPSPGSIYPTLQALEDQGLVQVQEVDGRRTASLTEDGRAWVEEHAPDEEQLFATQQGRGAHREVMAEMRTLAEAVTHVVRSADSPEAAARATEILSTARKDLYRLLAED